MAAKVRITISSGLVDLNRHLKQATVRRNVVVQLIRMFKDANHEDYRHLDMATVQRKAEELASTDEPTVPNGLAELLDQIDTDVEQDKAATPAERMWSGLELQREMD